MNATDGFSQTSNGSWGKFDEFLVNSSGTSIFTGTDLNASNYEALLIGGAANGLFFQGPNTTMTGIYTPSTFEEGSSGSHLDDENPSLNGLMMLAATGPGLSARVLSPIEQNIFRDIGYTQVSQISAIPEPSSVAFLFGIVTAVSMNWRRRKQSITA